MGTSKGYIAPSTPSWSKVKRNVSIYVGNPSTTNQAKVASSFANSMNTNGLSTERVSKVFSGFLSFVTTSEISGISQALQEIGCEDILSLSPEVALDELLSYFADNGSTIDDLIALDCLSSALIIFHIDTLDDIKNVDISQVLKELVCQFGSRKFAQMFDKQIRNKRPNVVEANTIINEMQKYIYYTLESRITDKVLSSLNPHNLTNEAIVQSTLQEGFKLMIECYGE